MEGIEGVEERVVNASALDVSSFIVQATSTPKKKMKASLVCDTCGKLFGSKKGLTAHHRQRHAEDPHWPHKCQICQKSYRLKSDLYSHVDAHKEESNHVCDHCGKSYRYVRSLRRHLLVCKSEAEWRCEQCTATFSSKSGLQDHQIAKHGTKRLVCGCGKRFRWRSSLRRHRDKCESV